MQEILVRFLGWKDLLEKGHPLRYSWASLVAQLVKNPPAMRETWVQFLGWEDPLEKEMATHFKCSCLENPMDKGAWQATVHGVAESNRTKATKPPSPHTVAAVVKSPD